MGAKDEFIRSKYAEGRYLPQELQYTMKAVGEGNTLDETLLAAAAEGDAAIVSAALKMGADPTVQHRGGQGTALHEAAVHGHTAVARLLMNESTVDLHSLDSEGRTALQVATEVEHVAM